jgi:hypothetical protein
MVRVEEASHLGRTQNGCGLASGWLSADWTWVSRARRVGGRKRVNEEIRILIFRMVGENPTWGAPRIHGELLKLGFHLSETTVSRWFRRVPRNPDPAKRWITLRGRGVGREILHVHEHPRNSVYLFYSGRSVPSVQSPVHQGNFSQSGNPDETNRGGPHEPNQLYEWNT